MIPGNPTRLSFYHTIVGEGSIDNRRAKDRRTSRHLFESSPATLLRLTNFKVTLLTQNLDGGN
jgi:hypothetical protein